jgi:hypothetical protein
MKKIVVDKASLCNVVLLGYFALGLGLSSLMVKSRTAIELSAPVELPGEGLSVSVPVGTGWKSLTEWTYERDNSYTLVSAYSIQGPPMAEVRWQYRLAEKSQPAEDLLREYAGHFAGQAGEIQRFESSLTFCWLHLFPRTSDEDLLLAVAVPAEGRALMLQLRSYAEPLYIRELFERLAAAVQIHADPRKEAGNKLTADLPDRIYGSWLRQLSGRPAAFLISPAGAKPIGYSRTAAAQTDPDQSMQTGLDYEEVLPEGREPGKTVSRLRAAEDFSEFVWTTDRLMRRRASQTVLHLRPGGALEIRDSYGRNDTVWPAPSAVPEILLPAVAWAMSQSDQTEAIVDVIASAGWIVPAVLSTRSTQAALEKIDKTEIVVRIDFLHDNNNFEEYYFDSQQNLIGKYEQMPGQAPRLWKPASREEILFHFGNFFDKPDKSAQKTSPPEKHLAFGTHS